MKTKGKLTREKILSTAEALILEKGFSGTTLDDIVNASGLSRGAFFFHFKSKDDLARSVVERFWENDYELFRGFAERAKQLADDPLQEALIFLKLFEEFVEGITEPMPGCVFASYTYESQQFDPSIHEYIRQGFDKWCAMYVEKFEAVLARYDPVIDVTARELAEAIISVIEGGFILARSYRDPKFVTRQSKQFRQYLQLVFRNALTLPEH